jgi:hypothetical protein
MTDLPRLAPPPKDNATPSSSRTAVLRCCAYRIDRGRLREQQGSAEAPPRRTADESTAGIGGGDARKEGRDVLGKASLR